MRTLLQISFGRTSRTVGVNYYYQFNRLSNLSRGYNLNSCLPSGSLNAFNPRASLIYFCLVQAVKFVPVLTTPVRHTHAIALNEIMLNPLGRRISNQYQRMTHQKTSTSKHVWMNIDDLVAQ